MHHDSDAEVVRIKALLKTAVQVAGRSSRSVERTLGLSAGYLSRLFADGIELKVRHVLGISGVIELDPAEFFQLALPGGSEFTSPTGRRLQSLFSSIPPAAASQGGPPSLSSEQLNDMVRGAVRAVFAELAAPPARS